MSFSRLIRWSILRNSQRSSIFSLKCLYSNKTWCPSPSTDPHITITDDGQTIVCWHSEPSFPYEHTKPIPQRSEILDESESALKYQYRIEGENLHTKNPREEELQMLTFTPRHVWNQDDRRNATKRRFENRMHPIHYKPGYHV